jgi:polysaccharide biosynthesis protein PslH
MRVLVITAQFPYPPRSGFARRVLHLSRQLARRHEVFLLSYAPPEDDGSVAVLEEEFPVTVVNWEPVSELAKRAQQLTSITSRRPFAARAVYSPGMQRAIDTLCAAVSPDFVQLESSVLAAFTFPPGIRLIVDEHNVESELLQRMGVGERSLLRRAFNQWDYRRYRRFERQAWRRADGCLITSPREEPVVRASAPETPTAVVHNGVDLEYFAPSGEPVTAQTVVFNGVLDYRPNLDAALYLVEEVWPRLMERCRHARLTLVGRGYPGDLRGLSRPGVEVTGEVPDLRPYLAQAAVVSVPIRIGGGTRLKVLEGLSMGKAMVTTSLGCEGIGVRDREHLLIADDADAFAARIAELFADPALGAQLGRAGRGLVEREFSWRAAGERMEALYHAVGSGEGAAHGSPLRPGRAVAVEPNLEASAGASIRRAAPFSPRDG